MHNRSDEVKELIKNILDFPQKGIIFRDITSLLNNKKGISLLTYVMECMLNEEDFNKVVAIEARGFILGSLIASIYEVPLVLARKPGKLPGEVLQKKYNLEYGENSLCIQTHDIEQRDNVIIVDDVLATGGTAKTACEIVETLGGNISSCYFLIELDYLKGKEFLKNYKVLSSINY